MANLSLRNVYKEYTKGIAAVSDFNLEIKDNEFVVFVGPSGCGKSTTLRMIAGLEEISKGEIYIEDKLINDVSPKDRDIAMVFQNYALYPHMTVFENMAFALKLRKVSKDDIKTKVLEAAKILDIEYLLDRKPKELSGGQRQRVALGRAIVRHPKVFLMDEPLSNLDAKLRGQMRTEISKLHRSLRTTFIYVTHDQVEAMTMGTRIVVMKDGFIQQVDTPQALYEKPCNKFVAGFLGTPQINFIDTTVVKQDGHVFLCFEKFKILMPDKKAAILDNEGYAGKTVTMGVRSEDIHEYNQFMNDAHLSPGNLNQALNSGNIVEATVDVVEMLGAETLLFLKSESVNFVVKVSERTRAKLDATIKVVFDADMIHVFDKDTEKAIFN